jgi:hypothetical protein
MGYHHNKGLLLDAFLRQKPEWVTSVLVFDDNKEVIKDMEHFTSVAKVSFDEGKAEVMGSDVEVVVPVVSVVPVTSKDLPLEYYEQRIATHLASVH